MKKITTFIADDSTIVRERLIEILSRFDNVEIIGQSGNGEEALNQILEHQPDVVLLDVNMPGLSGIEVLMRVKAVQPDIKVILFTSYSAFDLEKECLNRGADFFFQSNNLDVLLDLFRSMQNNVNKM